VARRAQTKRGRGRPSKLSPELQGRIVRQLRAGNYIETAAAACGVSKVTLYSWMRLGADEQQGPHVDFLNAVETSLAEGEQRDVARIDRAAGRTWRAAAWRLERRHPGRWGQRVTVAIQEHLTAFLDHLERALDAGTFQRVLIATEAWKGSDGPAQLRGPDDEP
jgi:transposase